VDATSWVWEELRDETAGGVDPAEQARREEEQRVRQLEEERMRAFAEGRQAGEAEMLEDFAAAVEVLDHVLQALAEAREEWQRTAEANLVALATAIAREIVGRELRGDAEAYADLVREALAKCPPDQELRIRVNPRDLSTISTISARLGNAVPIEGRHHVEWIADPAVAPGGCLVEGPDRLIDGRVDTALERVYRMLVDG